MTWLCTLMNKNWLEQCHKHATEEAVDPLGENPEEEDDEDETNGAADVDKLLRRSPASQHFVAGKNDGPAIERIDGQDVEYAQNQRQRHHGPYGILPTNR